MVNIPRSDPEFKKSAITKTSHDITILLSIVLLFFFFFPLLVPLEPPEVFGPRPKILTAAFSDLL